jgi:hypothetical protein
MPDYHPSFDITFGFNLFIIFMLLLVVAKGHLLPFRVKWNLMCLAIIPFVIALPICCEYIKDQDIRYYTFLLILTSIGVLSAFPSGSLFGQAAVYPDGEMLAAVSFGTGLSGILINLLQAIILVIELHIGTSAGGSFIATLVFYSIAALFLMIASLLYFVERTNHYSRYYTRMQKHTDRKKGNIEVVVMLK